MKREEKSGSEVVDGVLIGGYRGRRPLNKKRVKLVLRALGLVTLVVVVVATAVYFLTPKQITYDTSSPAYARLTALQARPIPKDDREKVTYYSHIADAYSELGDHQKALDTMLKADTYIKNRTVEAGQSVNTAVARYYKQIGNKDKAREYYQREIDRIKGDPTAADNVEVIQAIEKLKGDL